MSTNSGIGILQRDGKTVKCIYCHFDGYLEHNGELLAEYWTNTRDVEELINLGNISVLGKEIGEKQDFNNRTSKDWCLAYGRDRGERDQQAEVMNLEDFASYLEYNYVFNPKTLTWCVACSDTRWQFVYLEDALQGHNNQPAFDKYEGWFDDLREPEVSGGMNPSQQEIEDFFTGASTMINKRRILAADEPEDFEDPRIDEADELQTRVEDDFEYVMTGIERLGREGMLDEAIELLHTLADTLDSAVNIIGDDFESGSEIPPEDEL